MRRDEQSFDLFAGIVGKREGDPIRACSFDPRPHLDAANDAVGAGRGRDDKTVVVGMIGLKRLGQIDGLRFDRHAHRRAGACNRLRDWWYIESRIS